MDSDNSETIEVEDDISSNQIKNDLKNNFNMNEEDATEISNMINSDNLDLPKPNKYAISDKIKDIIYNNGLINITGYSRKCTIKDIKVENNHTILILKYNNQEYKIHPHRRSLSNLLEYKNINRLSELKSCELYINNESNKTYEEIILPRDVSMIGSLLFNIYTKSNHIYYKYYPKISFESNRNIFEYISLISIYSFVIYPFIITSLNITNIITVLATIIFIPNFILLLWMSFIIIAYYISNMSENNFRHKILDI